MSVPAVFLPNRTGQPKISDQRRNVTRPKAVESWPGRLRQLRTVRRAMSGDQSFDEIQDPVRDDE